MEMTSDKPELFLKNSVKHAGLSMRLAVASGAFVGILLVAYAYLLAKIVDGLFFKHQPIGELSSYFYMLIAILVLRFLCSVASDRFAYKAAVAVKLQLRTELYEKLRRLGGGFINNRGSGALLNTLSDGIEGLEKYYAHYLPAKALVMFVPMAILAVALPLDTLSFFVFLLTAPLIPLFMILIGKGAEKLNQEQWQKLARMGNHLLDIVQGATTIKIFNAERAQGEMISNMAEAYREDTMRILRVAFLSAMALEFFATVSIAVVAVLIGFRLLWGEMEFFNGFMILLLAPEFYIPFRRLGLAYHARMEAIGAVGKMTEIFSAEPNFKNNGKECPELSKIDIEFSGIRFAYQPEKQVLSRVDFTIKAGQKVALIGKSGAGKTTIVRLLLGLLTPQSGSIKINGHNLADIYIKHWRNNIAWVPQNPTLFAGTVMDNLRLGNNLSDDEIKRRCRQMNLDSFICALPQAYATIVGDNGCGLSGGEIQRIAIARALLRDAPLLLLDEPTASLDKETEDLLQRAISELSADKTVITIAHRLYTVTNAEKIIYLDDGIVKDSGVDEFIANNEEILR